MAVQVLEAEREVSQRHSQGDRVGSGKGARFSVCLVLVCLGLTTCRILTFQPGIKPVSPAVEAQRTGREVPLLLFLKPQDSLSIINNV